MKFRAEHCPCGHKSCADWHVYPPAAVQGVSFTRDQAEAVANLLELMATRGPGKYFVIHKAKET